MTVVSALSEDEINRFNFKNHDGYIGAFTTDESKWASIPNGARVMKQNSGVNDNQANGALGTVLGSFASEDGMLVMYCIEWDLQKRIVIFVSPMKIRVVKV